jgi:hypothetical protein
MKALTLKMETVIVIDEGMWKVTCHVYYVCEIDIEFLLSRHFMQGGMTV